MVKQFLVKMTLAMIFLALFSLKFVDVTIGERLFENPLETAWKATGLPLNEVSTETWMKLNNKWLTEYELKPLADKIKNKLCLDLKSKPTFGQQDDLTFASFEGKRNDGTVVTVTVQSTRAETGNETQLGVNTSHNGIFKDLRNYLEVLKEQITNLGNDPHFKVLLVGEYQGKIAPEVIRGFSGRIFGKIKADLIDSNFVEGNSSQKGYSNLIPDSVKYESRQVNVEIGTRYDETRNITQVIIASPELIDEP